MILLSNEDLEFERRLSYMRSFVEKSWNAMVGAARNVDARGIWMFTTSDGAAPLATTQRPTWSPFAGNATRSCTASELTGNFCTKWNDGRPVRARTRRRWRTNSQSGAPESRASQLLPSKRRLPLGGASLASCLSLRRRIRPCRAIRDPARLLASKHSVRHVLLLAMHTDNPARHISSGFY